MARTVLITGASSGLGLAFLKHHASQPATSIVALDVVSLPADIASPSNISFHKVDVTSETSLSSVAGQLKDTPIQLLIHSAGIRGLVPEVVKEKTGDVAAAEALDVINHATMMRTFETNTWGTFNTIRTFLPNFRQAASSDTAPRVVILSSRMGSLAANTAGGGYAYRASKAALNAVIKSFSIDVPEVAFLLLHPGRVETGLVEWKEEGAVSAEESLVDCSKVIDKMGTGDGVRYVDRFGVKIEW